MDYKLLRSHIKHKINSAKLEWFPFPHVIIGDFLPEDIYKEVQELNPFKTIRGERWNSGKATAEKPMGDKKPLNATPYHLRSQINFHKKNFKLEGPPEMIKFWEEMNLTFSGGAWFPRLIYKKFPEYFALRFGENVLRDDFWRLCRSTLFLQRHELDYQLGPHTDQPTRIFTCLFSFADGPGYEEYGTQIMRHKQPYIISNGRRHFEFDEFESVKLNEYKPNNFMLFFKTAHSFHAVKPILQPLPNERYGMQFQFHEPRTGLMRELDNPVVSVSTSKVKKSEPVAAE